MLTYLPHSGIDKAKWDIAIDKSLTPYPYAYSWYLDIVSPGWEALADTGYNNIIPLPWREKGGIKYLYQPFFTQQFGVFQQVHNETIIQQAISFINTTFRYAEFQLNYCNNFNANNYQHKQRVTFHINLNDSYEIIKKNYNNNLKRNLQKARAYLFDISKTDDGSQLIKIFRSTKGKEVNELTNNDYKTLEIICKTAAAKEYGKIYLVKSNDLVLAAGFFLFNHKYIINLFPATTPKGKETNAMPFLIDNILQQHASSNKIFDFEGSDIPSVARFYKSFGAVEVPYLKICINKLPWHIRILKRIKDGL